MALCEIHLTQQNALQKMTSATVIVPEKMEGPFPVLYLLHGLSDDHTIWTRMTSVERYVRDLPLIVVMPDSERGWYTDSVTNPNQAFETMIARDLVEFIDGTFRTKACREGRAACGLSMGGYGALKLALKHPDVFCAGVSFSGALLIGPLLDERHGEMRMIFGDDPRGGPNDLVALAENINRSLLPALYMDCGTEDFLIDNNRQMHALLDSLDIPHEYHENPGAHTWDYWDRAIVDALPFIRRALGIG